MKIGVIVGSLRKESFSRKIAENLAKLLPAGFEAEFIDIGNLPLYNEEYDDNNPPEYTAFRNKIKGLEAVLIVTPEYNRSYPAALKNALDIGSRPYGQNLWSGKPTLLVSQSIGAIGGFGANQHLRQVLAFLNMPVLLQPEVYIGNSSSLFDANGKLTNQDTAGFLQTIIDSFIDFIKKHKA